MAEVELPNPEEIKELRENTFTKRIALLTAVYAVFLVIVSLGGNNAAKELSLSQQQASSSARVATCSPVVVGNPRTSFLNLARS